jgi:hypothetical protein
LWRTNFVRVAGDVAISVDPAGRRRSSATPVESRSATPSTSGPSAPRRRLPTPDVGVIETVSRGCVSAAAPSLEPGCDPGVLRGARASPLPDSRQSGRSLSLEAARGRGRSEQRRMSRRASSVSTARIPSRTSVPTETAATLLEPNSYEGVSIRGPAAAYGSSEARMRPILTDLTRHMRRMEDPGDESAVAKFLAARGVVRDSAEFYAGVFAQSIKYARRRDAKQARKIVSLAAHVADTVARVREADGTVEDSPV